MTVPPDDLNMDVSGNRVAEPKTYGAFVKLRGFAPRSHKIQWSAEPAPLPILLALLAQLKRAEQQVRDQLTAAT